VVVLPNVRGNLFAPNPPTHVVFILREHFDDRSGPGSAPEDRDFWIFTH